MYYVPIYWRLGGYGRGRAWLVFWLLGAFRILGFSIWTLFLRRHWVHSSDTVCAEKNMKKVSHFRYSGPKGKERWSKPKTPTPKSQLTHWQALRSPKCPCLAEAYTQRVLFHCFPRWSHKLLLVVASPCTACQHNCWILGRRPAAPVVSCAKPHFFLEFQTKPYVFKGFGLKISIRSVWRFDLDILFTSPRTMLQMKQGWNCPRFLTSPLPPTRRCNALLFPRSESVRAVPLLTYGLTEVKHKLRWQQLFLSQFIWATAVAFIWPEYWSYSGLKGLVSCVSSELIRPFYILSA